MANCESIQVELSAYLDGEVPPSDRAALEAHLRDCAACREALSDLESARNALAEMPRLKAPKSLAAAIRRNLAQPDQGAALPAAAAATNVVTFESRKTASSWRPALLGIAAMLLAAVLIFLLLPLIANDSNRQTALQESKKNAPSVSAAPEKFADSRRETNEPTLNAQPPAAAAPQAAPELDAKEKSDAARKLSIATDKKAPAAPPAPVALPVTEKPGAPKPSGTVAGEGGNRSEVTGAAQPVDQLRDRQASQAQRNLMKRSDELARNASQQGMAQKPARPADEEEQRSNDLKPGSKDNQNAEAFETKQKSAAAKVAENKSGDIPAPANSPGGMQRGANQANGAKAPGRVAMNEDDAAAPAAPAPKPAAKAEERALETEKKAAVARPHAGPQSTPPAVTPAPAPESAPGAPPEEAKAAVPATDRGQDADNASKGGIANNGFVGGAGVGPGGVAGGYGGGDGGQAPRAASRRDQREELTLGKINAGRQRIFCREAELPALLEKLQRLAESSGGKLNAPPEVAAAGKPAQDSADKVLKSDSKDAVNALAAEARAKHRRTLSVVLTVRVAERQTVVNHIAGLADSSMPAPQAAANDAGGDLAQHAVEDKRPLANSTNKKDAAAEEQLKKEAEAPLELRNRAPEPAGTATITIDIITMP